MRARTVAHSVPEVLGILVTSDQSMHGHKDASRSYLPVFLRKVAKAVPFVPDTFSPPGQAAVRRLVKAYPNAVWVHTPVHASWLNQVEISCSIVQRKVLTPNDFASLEAVEQRLRLYEALSNQQPRPFAWQFTRAKLEEFLKRLEAHEAMLNRYQAVPELPDID